MPALLLMIAVACTTDFREKVTDSTDKIDLVIVRTEIQAWKTDIGRATTQNDLSTLLEYYANDVL